MTITRPYPSTNVDLHEMEERLDQKLVALNVLLTQLYTWSNSATTITSSQRKEKLSCQDQEQKRKRKLKLPLLPAFRRK